MLSPAFRLDTSSGEVYTFSAQKLPKVFRRCRDADIVLGFGVQHVEELAENEPRVASRGHLYVVYVHDRRRSHIIDDSRNIELSLNDLDSVSGGAMRFRPLKQMEYE